MQIKQVIDYHNKAIYHLNQMLKKEKDEKKLKALQNGVTFHSQTIMFLMALSKQSKTDLKPFWNAQAEWSEATFGAGKSPIGALKHLAKEVQETLENPKDYMEYANCFLLLVDSCRKAGLTPEQLFDVVWKKLEINKARKWPEPKDDDEPVEHIREEGPALVGRDDQGSDSAPATTQPSA